ncbi:MAG: hypothetical protein HFJ75_00985 [Eggerthellaceae bacterium]|nr:hypothetical protein [Eggerthellaceae bacterium]
MRKRITAAAVAGLLALSLGALGGCAAPSAESPERAAERAAGEPPLMPASHEGRFYELGADGCYGCHGATEATDHMLAQAPALPDDHYVDGDPATLQVFAARGECLTCHPQG